MNNENVIIKRIPWYYVGDDCVQIMIPHRRNGITLFNGNDILFHYVPNSTKYVNKYYYDERKNNFPYSKIPTHFERIFGKKYEYVNQLIEFNKVYISISKGSIIEYYAVKDEEGALLAIKNIIPNEESEITMTQAEAQEYIDSARDNCYHPDGEIVPNLKLRSGSEFLELYKQDLEYRGRDDFGYYYGYDGGVFKQYSKHLEDINQRDIPARYFKDTFIFVFVQNNNNKIYDENNTIIKYVKIEFKPKDTFLFKIYNCPFTVYDLEYMKYLEQTNSKKNIAPKFPRLLNPQIDRCYIKQEKERVKTLKLI